MFKVVVVGGGISGMASAFLIKEALSAANIEHDLKVIEAAEQPGGKVKTFKGSGFTCETGSNGFLDNKPLSLELVSKVGADDLLLRSDESAALRFIYAKGRLHQLSANPMKLMLDDLLSVSGRIRLILEAFGKKRPEGIDESIADFARRRVGKDAFEMLIDPMVSGIHAGNPEELSLKSCFQRMYEMETEYGSLTKALLALKKNKGKQKSGGGPSGPGGRLTSFKGGLGQIIEKISDKLGENSLICGQPVERVTRLTSAGRPGYQVDFAPETGLKPLAADVVIFTSPTFATSKITKELDPKFSEIHSNILYSKVNVICLGFPKADFDANAHGFGFLIPSREQRKILGCLWTSSIFPDYRAPDDYVLLRAMVGGTRHPERTELDDEATLKMVLSELRDIMGVTCKPDFVQIFRHPWAIPRYQIGHADRLDKIEKRLTDLPGIFTAGNAYEGIGFNDCIISANKAAAAVKGYLSNP